MSTVSAAPAAESPAPMSFAGRFVGIFYSPGETFADIVRRPGFIAPLVVLVISTLAATEAMLAKIGMERIIRLSMEQNKSSSSMSAEQMQAAVERGASIGAVMVHVSGILGPPVFLLIIAGIGLLIVNVIFGAQSNFKTAFSVTCYANLVGVPGALMALALILFGDPEHFNAQNLMPSNPGFFLNPLETSKALMAAASSLDIFTLWFMALLGIGFSAATGQKVKAGVVFLTFLGLWLVYVLGKVGLAMLT